MRALFLQRPDALVRQFRLGPNPDIMPPEPNVCFRETTKEASMANIGRKAAIHVFTDGMSAPGQ